MSSINQGRTEEHREDLEGSAAIAKVRELIEQSAVGFFCTNVPPGNPGGARPMSVLEVDDEGNLWFLSPSDSHQNQELALDPSVRLYFQGSQHSDFLQVNGHAAVSTDQARIEQLWSPLMATWFTGGQDDPRITVIKVMPTGGYYWDTKHGKAVAGVKILLGAVLRKPMDDSIQGRLEV
jgi:general stress protein 26